MKGGLELFDQKVWQPLSYLGLKHKFFNINVYTVLYTWVIIIALALVLIPIYFALKRKPGLVHFVATSFVDYFAGLVKTSLGFFSLTHFTFITGLFTFILLCNAISIFPWTEEPTKDLSTTLALGLISFLYIQVYSIKSRGFWDYTKEYFEPFFIMFPLNVVGKVATVVSLSFRLFGNIFGGVIIAKIFMNAIKGAILTEIIAIPVNITITVFFGLFEGALQAFVFMMLTITYLSTSMQSKKPRTSGETK